VARATSLPPILATTKRRIQTCNGAHLNRSRRDGTVDLTGRFATAAVGGFVSDSPMLDVEADVR
jgi:hypothetical protein